LTAESRLLKEEKLRRLYRSEPEAYAEDVLGVKWWSKQREIANALLKHKRVFVKACHSIGKTHLAGGLVNWFFDCWQPGITLTTAPTQAQVTDLTWKEVRVQRRGRPGLLPKAPRMETSPDHFASGFTAGDATSFHGRHEERMLIIFDEAVGIDGEFWEAAEGMMTGDGCYWLAIMNPTDTSSRAYQEQESGDWHIIEVSALDHPNIAADLAGKPAPFPKAVRLSFIESRLKRWATPIPASDKRAGDIEFPPGSGQWWRPGPLFESRVLGRWPSTGTDSVWSDALWAMALVWQPEPEEPTEIGCDVARYGEDYTSIIVRRGRCVLHWETHNGWGTDQTAGRLKQLAAEYAQEGEDPTQILIKVDDDGVGGGVWDQRGKHRFIRMNAQSNALQNEDYPNRRSEYWFATAERAGEGRIDVSRLSEEAKRNLRQQLMMPKWKVDSSGRRVVEQKDDTKKRLKRSPDDADAFNLAFAPPPPSEQTVYRPTNILSRLNRPKR
jgi:hypothetical protein